MFAEERRNKILDILDSNKEVNVKSLSDLFEVSEVIIRKDLKKLEENNQLQRTHGGAIPSRRHAVTSNINSRVIKINKEKIKIAELGFKQINNGDSILLDSSSINLEIAKLIHKSTLQITVITNMLEIAHILAGTENISVICTGGHFHSKIGVFCGSLTIDNIKKFNVDKLFLGVAGININKGYLSNFDIDEGKTKNVMIDISSQIYLIAETSKFYQDALYNFTSIDKIDKIITDSALEPELINKLNKYNIDLIY
ncbi:MAG: DeoR/GlpR transcriptional regulator [bacterium]|nr:DeoR/GlpR transcriptional regulator [bacterium]